jgi:hypothetical protein
MPKTLAKKPAPAKKPAAAKARPKAALPPTAVEAPVAHASTEPSTLLLVLLRIKARIPALSELQRVAFHSLMTDPQRAALGARTKGEAVATDAVAWIVQIDEDAREYPALFTFYAAERFAYLVERTEALVQQLITENGKRGAKGTIKGAAATASETAKLLRNRLLRRLESYAGDRDAEEDEIAKARGTIADDDATSSSIHDLVKLAQAWMARATPQSHVLIAAAGLTPALCEEALRAAQALTGAAADATEAGRARATDSPAVNVREGGVLREMREAMIAIEEAHEQHGAIRRLTPGAATRGVLGPRRALPKAPEEASKGAPAGG